MKSYISAIVILLCLLACNRNKVKVSGEITNSENTMIYFEKIGVYSTKMLDSALLKSNGKFAFKTSMEYPMFYQLRFENNEIISLLLEPGEKVHVTADLNNLVNSWHINGSQGSILVASLNDKLFETRKKLDTIKVLFEKSIDATVKDSLIDEYERIIKDHRRFTISFILEFQNSMASIMALYQQLDDNAYVLNRMKDIQYFKIASDSLFKKYPRSKHVIALKKNTERLLEKYKEQKLLSMAKVNEEGIPDIALPNVKDDTVKLSSIKGKYVLLSFWASWDNPSIEYSIELKDIYAKFRKRGFEVYHVAFDKSKESWLKAVKFDALPWINVIDSTFPNSYTAMVYNVQKLPANYLIDKNFEDIIAKNINPAKLDSKLSELLN